MEEQSDNERKVLAALEAKLVEKARNHLKVSEGDRWRREGSLIWATKKELFRELAHTTFGRQALTYIEVQAVRGALQQAAADGLLAHGSPDDGFAHNLGVGDLYTLTPRGIRYYSAQQLSLVSEHDFVNALRDLRARRSTAIDGGQVALLDEAYRSWAQGCYRAAMVLIGVASEDSLGTMLDALEAYPAKDPAQGPAKDWTSLRNARNISGRFAAGIVILKRLEKELRSLSNKATPRPGWADVWFRNIDALASIGDAVRYARNKAAHDGAAAFRRSDVGLILASTPTLLEQIDEIRAFLGDLAAVLGPGVAPPSV